MSAPFSLDNPPNAPKKSESLFERRSRLHRIPKLRFPDEEEEKKTNLPEWRALRDSGYVREKFLLYTPEDVEEIDDIDFLLKIREWYFPASQPRNLFEETYIKLVWEMADKKLYAL